MSVVEQVARGRAVIELVVNDAVWVCFVVAVAMINGNGFNKRVAGGMFLASIPLEIAMVLFGVVPLIEWVTLPSFPGSLDRALMRLAFAGRQAMPVRTASG
jgi:hypothetical protein